MFDARYVAFATISALLVISPGATMAVVMETAIGEGRAAALLTVAGINIGNSSLAIASALGLSLVFHQWPWTLEATRIGGAGYLTYLGARGLWRAWRAGARPAGTPGSTHAAIRPPGSGVRPAAYVVRGIMTNLLNPPVVIFYMTFLPQFIGPQDTFLPRFAVLAATHVSMSLVWLTFYAFTLGVLAERFARPAVRRTLEAVTGTVLVGFGVRLVLR